MSSNVESVRADSLGDRAEPSGEGMGVSPPSPGLWGNDPIVLSSDSGSNTSQGSSSSMSDGEVRRAVDAVCGFDYYDGQFEGRSLREGMPDPPHHWELQGADGKTHYIQMPLRSLGESKIKDLIRSAGIPECVILRGAVAGEEDPTRLPNNYACIHPVLFNWGLRLPLPRFLAHFCAYLGVPIGQLSANCLWILTCLHVIWRVCGCEYPTPAEVLQLYAPRLGSRKGHHGVVELKERTGLKRIEDRPLLRGLPTSQTTYRDTVCIAIKGWRYMTSDGSRPFKSYGTWAGLKKGKNIALNSCLSKLGHLGLF